MTDWLRVERAVYRVRQHYRYTYTGPVWDLRQRLLMIPRDAFRDQRVRDLKEQSGRAGAEQHCLAVDAPHH